MVVDEPLDDLRVGWQKIADRYHLTVFVFRVGKQFAAVTNRAQVVGEVVETIEPQSAVEPAPNHGRFSHLETEGEPK